jgi:hypothetical protein
MTDPLKINNLMSRLKSRFVKDNHGSGVPWVFSKKQKEPSEQFVEEKKATVFDNPENEKFFKLGETLGLTKKEVIEALELLFKATEKYPENMDAGSVVLTNELVKFPYVEDFQDDIPDKLLQEMEKRFPDLYLAITTPFEFMCKYPATISNEYYVKFSYTELLDFGRKCPEQYEKLSEINKVDGSNDSS